MEGLKGHTLNSQCLKVGVKATVRDIILHRFRKRDESPALFAY